MADVSRVHVEPDEGSREAESSRQLGDVADVCPHFHGGSEIDGPCRLRYIKRIEPEAFAKLEILREQVVGRYVRAILDQGFSPTRKYASDVYIYRDDEQRTRMLRRLNEHAVGYPGRLLLWTNEGDHLHVVHDCAFSNGQCRCYFAKTEDFRRNVRNPMRRIKFLTEMDELDWTNVFLYFVLSKREVNTQVWIGGRLQRSPSNDEVVRWRHLQEQSGEILGRQEAGVRRNDQRQVGHRQIGGQVIHEGDETHGVKRSAREGFGGGEEAELLPPAKRSKLQSKFQRISETVQTLLDRYVVLPAHHIRDVLVNRDCALYLFDPSNEKAYYAACDIFSRRFVKFKLRDFKLFYENCQPTFYANDENPFVYYHDRTESLKHVNELLQYQFNGDDESVSRFLTNVRDWFDLRGWGCVNKINAICCTGPPNSGKNYFWDMFAAIAYNVGHIGRVNNKTNQFALQECYGRRMVVGNEISMEDGAKEDFKKLCEGTAFNIRVKYQGDKIFTKAPVLLISNNELDICYDRHFINVRLHHMRWRTCSKLKESKLKPYPLCIFDLFDLYNVSLDEA